MVSHVEAGESDQCFDRLSSGLLKLASPSSARTPLRIAGVFRACCYRGREGACGRCAQVMGFLDGAALLDILPAAWSWSPNLVPLQQLMANMTAFVSPSVQPYCAAIFGTALRKCASPSTRA